ncbi:MAG: hypothetical protein KME45_25315 [Stenomitos rutilans HA7619-LM2]|jgi:hypothetical protein|nr:hypothetical protein [Stenomitos rutilans HA7619-LM2]
MGGNAWHYFVPFDKDVNSTLQRLREQEFRAGRYGVSSWMNTSGLAAFIGFEPAEFETSTTSAEELIEEHGSLEAAIEAVFADSEPDGTTSILDMFQVSEEPEACAVCPLSNDDLSRLFGTDKPTHEIVESILIQEQNPDVWEEFWDSIDRGEGRYIVLYQNDKPTEIFFAGYSFD